MSNFFKLVPLALGFGPQLQNAGEVTAMDSSSTTLPTGSAPTADGVTLQNYNKVLYSALTTNPGVYEITGGVGTPSGATFSPVQQLPSGDSGLQPSLGCALYVQEGTSNGGTCQVWNGSEWVSASVSIGV